MDKQINNQLLPEGLKDLLSEEATKEEVATRKFLDNFISYGYKLIKPPLMEYEDTINQGIISPKDLESFSLMDPNSNRIMNLRPDITSQIARISQTRLKNFPRPLRLIYAGEVLRNKTNDSLI